MPASTRRSAARLVAMVLLVALVGGCAGQRDDSTAAGQSTTSTTVAPTTTTIPPLDAKELAWLKGISAVRTKVENSFQAKGSGPVTRAIMLESGNELASWSRQLRQLGAPPIASSRRIRSSRRSSRPTTRVPSAMPGRPGR